MFLCTTKWLKHPRCAGAFFCITPYKWPKIHEWVSLGLFHSEIGGDIAPNNPNWWLVGPTFSCLFDGVQPGQPRFIMGEAEFWKPMEPVRIHSWNLMAIHLLAVVSIGRWTNSLHRKWLLHQTSILKWLFRVPGLNESLNNLKDVWVARNFATGNKNMWQHV